MFQSARGGAAATTPATRGGAAGGDRTTGCEHARPTPGGAQATATAMLKEWFIMRLMQSMDITLGRLAVGRDGRKRAACMDAERPGMHSHAERGNDQKR